MSKKIIAILLILSICFTFSSCGKTQTNTPTETEKYVLPTEFTEADISLPYTSSDTLDPYTSKSSMNRDLIPIVFESLYTATKDGKGKMLLATSGTVNPDNVTVTIAKGIKFSDGVELNAYYVKYAFEKAKNNEYYKTALSKMTGITVIDNYTVKFTLSSNEPFALNVLNFPIVRVSDGEIIGSGKYKVELIEEKTYLQVNTFHRNYSENWNKQIALWDMAGLAGPIYSFKARDISVYKNDLIKDEYVNLSSKTISQDTNNLVYVGINSNWGGSVTSIPWVRQAINIGINRTQIASSSYLGQTEAVVTHFRTEFYQLNSTDLPSLSGEKEKAISILERNGFDSFNDKGVRTNGVTSLNVNILVCTSNVYKLTVAQRVKAALEELGFGVTITEKATQEELELALSEGFFNLYIGETSLPDNYRIDSFFTKDGATAYGVQESFFTEYDGYKSGAVSTMDFVEGFETEVPFIPLFYRKNIISVSDGITGVDNNHPYVSISDWKSEK